MNLATYKISTKILAVILFLGVVAAGIATLGINALSQLNDATDRMEVSAHEAVLGARVRQGVVAMNRAEYRIASNPSAENIAEAMNNLDEEITRLDQVIAESMATAGAQRKKLLEDLKEKYASYRKELDGTVATARKLSGSVNLSDQQKVLFEEVTRSQPAAKAFDASAKHYVDYVVEVSNSRSAEATETYHTASFWMIGSAVAGILAGLLLGLVISTKGIVTPIRKIVACLAHLAEGKLEIDVFGTDRKDEIGDIAKTTLVFKENMIRNKQMEEEQHKAQEAQAERARRVEALCKEFDAASSEAVKSVASAATQLEGSSEAMSATAEETTRQAAAVAAASEQASANVQTVASASEELASSISEISRQVSQASQIASGAVRQGEQTNVKVQGLAQAANKIGEVVALITDIAEQTNLLALNATIEAARAGDAGKGFAVVASEVKNLANQTAKATDEIGAQIAGIQTATREAVTAIEVIVKTISEIDSISSSIASAVEEQGAATQEIARNVEQAASGTQEVSSNIGGVSAAANDTGAAATQIQGASAELSRQSETLRNEVEKFLANVRAA
ncbi:methyl-accepting chemotaxis protein [Shumkonia mesophila]|uniref:methyl-accepting chemotaxis protein n=1 Tax=Shumkonia mesophila TaxID=2838854 RepID=UPI0029350997|nr:methyl-accepting chemotaxis protein [Shumkonia mesophila]